jgi:hypothetical protein
MVYNFCPLVNRLLLLPPVYQHLKKTICSSFLPMIYISDPSAVPPLVITFPFWGRGFKRQRQMTGEESKKNATKEHRCFSRRKFIGTSIKSL